MAAQLDISEMKGRFDELLARVRAGEEIVFSESGHPVVRLAPAGGEGNGGRIFGEFAGKVHMSDDFTAPLSVDERSA